MDKPYHEFFKTLNIQGSFMGGYFHYKTHGSINDENKTRYFFEPIVCSEIEQMKRGCLHKEKGVDI